MFIGATCATVAAMLAYASGGDTIQLTGNCGPIEIAKDYDRPVIIDATNARVRGLRITGTNVDWRGGTLSAQDGPQGTGPRGYAVYISGGAGVSISNATITAARMGAVVVKSRDIKFLKNNFTRLRVDGLNVSLTQGLTVSYNRFEQSLPNPSTCLLAGGKMVPGIKKSACRGAWTDGDHPDAVQMRNGVVGAVLDHNTVLGNTQGLVQMDTAGDAPLSKVRIWANTVQTSTYHPITLYVCNSCSIEGNTVKRAAGSPLKSVISQGRAARCGNIVPDQPGMDPVCKTTPAG
jgi:hypothetical protein